MFKNIPILPRPISSLDTDVLYLYLIINTDLNMSVGKIGGQIGHAIQYYMEEVLLHEVNNNIVSNFFNRYTLWSGNKLASKITLAANTKEFNKIKKEYDPIIVVDAGHTEIAAGSETVICLYPMFKDERSKNLKRLQTLKNEDVIK